MQAMTATHAYSNAGVVVFINFFVNGEEICDGMMTHAFHQVYLLVYLNLLND